LVNDKPVESGFKKITIPLGIQFGGEVEINSENYIYYTSNEENLFFGQGITPSGNNVINQDFSFYEDSDGLIRLGIIAVAVPA
jgi:hypothetical protein